MRRPVRGAPPPGRPSCPRPGSSCSALTPPPAVPSSASGSTIRASSSPASSTNDMAGPIPADAVSPPPPRRLRRYILGALAAALVLAAGYCFGYEPPYRGTLVERPPRSEEHTSELQSQSNLVCRLLL